MLKCRLFVVCLAVVLVFAASSAQSQMIIDLRMNEGSGTTVSDSSGNGNNGTIVNNGALLDSMDDITVNGWVAQGVEPGVRTIVDQNIDTAYVKQGAGSLKWTIVSDAENPGVEEHVLYSPIVGSQGTTQYYGWYPYDWVSFWMYVTSPTGGTKFGFKTQYKDDSAGWFFPLGPDGSSPAVNSDFLPMDEWVQVKLSLSAIGQLDRDKVTESLWTSYENGDTRFSVEDGHTFVLYIDDLRLGVPDGWTTGHTGSGVETRNIQNHYIVVPTSPSLDITGSFSASMWVKPEGTGVWDPVPGGQIERLKGNDFGFSKGGGLAGGDGDNGYAVYVPQNGIVHGVIAFQNGGLKDFWGQGTTVADRLIADQWNHVAIDFDGHKTYRLWVNNSLRHTGVLAADDTLKVSANDLRIGHSQWNLQINSFLFGVIDEFKITQDIPGAGGRIGGNITLQSFSGDKTLAPVRIELKQSGTGTIVDTQVKTLEASGAYLTQQMAPGLYDISFSGRGFLTKTVTGVEIVDNTTTPVDVTLLNGDVDGDNAVTTPDFSILSGNYGQ